ncbi:MAG: YhgE/Pip domain-containing protein, partial [Bacillota bacterium]|nr:YhgE/Pip domain-containing protein [Bacillota bacterium]
YYMAFVIPENFSESVISAESGTPQQAEIIYLNNVRKNFLLSQIGETVKTKFSGTVAQPITKEYSGAAFDSLHEVQNGMSEAADGSETLADGLNTLKDKVPALANGVDAATDGSAQVTSGLQKLNSNMPSLQKGASDASSGSASITAGLKELSDQMPTFTAGASQLSQGISSLAEQLPGLTNGLDQISQGATDINNGATALKQKVDGGTATIDGSFDQIIAMASQAQTPEEMAAVAAALQQLKSGYDSGQQQISTALSSISQGANAIQSGCGAIASKAPELTQGVAALQNGAASLNSGAQQISGGIVQLYEGSSSLSSGLASLKDGTDEVSNGVGKLYDGSSTLTSGLGTLDSAVPELSSGVVKLTEGGDTLATALKDGSEEINEKLVNTSDAMAEFMSKPEKTTSEKYGNLDYYGLGFAPFFLSLGLWIGALMIFFIIPPRPEAKLEANTRETVLGRLPLFFFVGTLQAVAISAAALIIDITITNLPCFFLFSIFVSLVFVLIMQSLNLLFGIAGKALAIVFLVLQLCSCGGTFPTDLIPSFFQKISPFMPFTYSVDGFRELISGGDMSVVLSDSLHLLIFAVIFLITSFIFNKVAQRKISKIHQGLEEDGITDAI